MRVSGRAAPAAKSCRIPPRRGIGRDQAPPLREAGGAGRRPSALLAALGLLGFAAVCATQANADVVVDGDREQMQVSVDNDTVATVLQALMQKGSLHYRSSLPLNKLIGGSFSGSLGHILSRVLVGFDFVAHYNPDGVEIFVYGESSATSVVPPQVEPESPRPRSGSRMTAQASLGANLAPRHAATPHQLIAPAASGILRP